MTTFNIVNIAEAFANKPEPLDFLFGAFKAGTIGALVAPGATGKSVCALQILAAVSSRYDITGCFPTTKAGRAVYLSGEDTSDIITQRLYHLGQSLPQQAREAMAQNAQIVPIVGQTPDILSKTWQDILLAHATDSRLLIIDTLRRFHSGDENDSGNMTRVIQALEYIASLTGCSILFLHHVNKASINGGGNDQGASRGSSAITDNIRWQANLAVMSELEAEKRGISNDERKSLVRFVVSKSNYGPPADAWLKRGPGGVLIPAIVPEASQRPAKKGGKTCDQPAQI